MYSWLCSWCQYAPVCNSIRKARLSYLRLYPMLELSIIHLPKAIPLQIGMKDLFRKCPHLPIERVVARLYLLPVVSRHALATANQWLVCMARTRSCVRAKHESLWRYTIHTAQQANRRVIVVRQANKTEIMQPSSRFVKGIRRDVPVSSTIRPN